MDIDVSIILNRREHWTWIQATEELSSRDFRYGSGWKRSMNPDLANWLEANGVAKTQHVVEIKTRNGGKGRKESYLRFKDLKTARHFVLVWNIPPKHIFLGHFDRRVANERLCPRGF